MQDVNIIRTDTDIRLVSPYHPDCPKKARAIGGKWDHATRSWRFDQRDHKRVEQLATDLWGWSGSNDTTTVTIRVNADDYCQDNEIIVAGRSVAYRPGRDASVRLADNVIIVHGRFADRAGSAKYPEVGDCDGVTLEIRDLPASALTLLDQAKYELVNDDSDPLAALREERQRLMARIAQIDKIISQHEQNGGTE